MKTSGVSRITVVTSFEAEEPVSALLETIFSETPTTYTSLEQNQSTVSLFTRKCASELRAQIPAINRGLHALRQMGLDTGASEIRISKVRREDWSHSWKKYFKTIQIGRALMIKPSWSRQKPQPGQALVVLDPGLSFGTGQHATTSFCLREIVRHNSSPGTKSLLDIGCGSGILAISAAKLGCRPVEAFDFDPVAVRVARKNCQINRVTAKVVIRRRDLEKLPLKSTRKFDLVCANLVSTLLLEQRDKIIQRLAPHGTLVLAGILHSEFPKVQAGYQSVGLKLRRTKVEREWQSGSFEFPRS